MGNILLINSLSIVFMLRLLEIFGCKRIKNVLCLLLHFLKEGFHENLKLTQNEE